MIKLWKHSGFIIVFQRLIILLGPLRGILIFYHRLVSSRKPKSDYAESHFTGIDKKAMLNNLRSNGFSKGIDLPEKYVTDILAFTGSTSITVGAHPGVIISTGDQAPPIKHIADYSYRNPHRSCAAINAISNDPAILGIAREYLGVANPVLYSTIMYWSFPKRDTSGNIISDNRQKKLFHFDVSDSKALSLFFYLTDVDENSGPHIVIAGTNHNRTLFNLLNWRLSDERAKKKYGDRIQALTGKRGTGFFEDLLNYHKHSLPHEASPRLMLALNYVIHRQPRS